jgi:lysophospholipase L1-like esterase
MTNIIAVFLLMFLLLNCSSCGNLNGDLKTSGESKLTYIEIEGPASIAENSNAQYLCKAYYSDGTTRTVEPESWDVNCPSLAVISENGHLSSLNVSSNKLCTISATYSEKGIIKSDTRHIIIKKELIIYKDDKNVSFSFVNRQISEEPYHYKKKSLEGLAPREITTFQASVKGPYQISLRWTITDDCCSSVSVKIYNDSVLLDTVYVDQRANRRRWNKLLSNKYIFNGKAKVEIISNGKAHCATCVDAVKFNYINYYVAFGDSITEGAGDDDPTDDVSMDGWTTGGGYPPVLADLLARETETPYFIANEGIGGITSKRGLGLLKQVLSRHPESMLFLVQFGTNDSWYKRPLRSGKGLQPGDSGYSGSFKDNMQQIITIINNAGKKVCLAKLPVVLGKRAYDKPYRKPSRSLKNYYIMQYNEVINELAKDPKNKITVDLPDFYSYFNQFNTETQLYRYDNEYADNLHPNGAGYQSMAKLWLKALTR